MYVVPVMSKYKYRRVLPDMYIYFHVHVVECVLPVIKDCANLFNHLQILLFMIDFNPKRNVSSSMAFYCSIGLHVHSISCALAKRDNSFIKC